MARCVAHLLEEYACHIKNKSHIGSSFTLVCDVSMDTFEAALAFLEITLELMLLEVLLENTTHITTTAPLLRQSCVIARRNDFVQLEHLEHLFELLSLEIFESLGKDLEHREHVFFVSGFASGRHFLRAS